jgi:hypothetical protein
VFTEFSFVQLVPFHDSVNPTSAGDPDANLPPKAKQAVLSAPVPPIYSLKSFKLLS